MMAWQRKEFYKHESSFLTSLIEVDKIILTQATLTSLSSYVLSPLFVSTATRFNDVFDMTLNIFKIQSFVGPWGEP